jgi:L-fucose mutarotase
MLLGLDPVLSPDLLHALAAMGHGDRLALVDANYPATRGRRLIELPGVDMPRALQAVLSVFPIDTFVPEPCAVMQVVGEPDALPPVQAEMKCGAGQPRRHAGRKPRAPCLLCGGGDRLVAPEKRTAP